MRRGGQQRAQPPIIAVPTELLLYRVTQGADAYRGTDIVIPWFDLTALLLGVPAVISAIEDYLTVHNAEPTPLVWTARYASLCTGLPLGIRRGRQ